VRVTAGGVAAPFGEDWSCGIKLGDGAWPGLVVEPLFTVDLLRCVRQGWQQA
jgi:LysR family glycine cleavage system transcriptional activator